MWIFLFIFIALLLIGIIFLHQPKFGSIPQGKRLEKIKLSLNFRGGNFRNQIEMPQLTSNNGFLGSIINFLFRDRKLLKPTSNLPSIKTNLHQISRNENLLVWFGHSSLFIQTDGIRFLIDPVFYSAAPFKFMNKPFPGTDIYKPEDIPDIDYLIISHDHWDHLDYHTIIQLKRKIGKVICGLGVGEHFERWKIKKENDIIELDWNDKTYLENNILIHCLPTHHFSGRGFFPNKSLWASFLIEAPALKIFLSGDGGYDNHFEDIKKKFPNIDLVIMENGQYDKNWKHIHLMPDELIQAVKKLNAKRLLTIHHSKYALANHPWNEPLENIYEVDTKYSLNLITPMIGEVVFLTDDDTQTFSKWWNIDKKT